MCVTIDLPLKGQGSKPARDVWVGDGALPRDRRMIKLLRIADHSQVDMLGVRCKGAAPVGDVWVGDGGWGTC